MADRCSHGARLGCCDECASMYEEAQTLGEVIAAALPELLYARLRSEIAEDIASLATDDSDVSDAYRHAAMIAKGTL